MCAFGSMAPRDIRSFFDPSFKALPPSTPESRPKKGIVNLGRESWLLHDELPKSLSWDYDALWNCHPPEFGEVLMFDRMVSTPRWQQAYMRPYYFTGILHDAPPLPPCFSPFLDWANDTGHRPYNAALINWYKDGSQYIGPHKDSDRQLLEGSTIMSISLGGTRTFRIRDQTTKNIVADLELVDGTYVVMGGNMQKHFTHEIVRVSGKRGASVPSRINITFRTFVDSKR